MVGISDAAGSDLGLRGILLEEVIVEVRGCKDRLEDRVHEAGVADVAEAAGLEAVVRPQGLCVAGYASDYTHQSQ